MWVHLLVIALLVYILWLVTKRRDSMFRPGKSLRNLRKRLKDAQKAKDLNDLIAMYQAKMNRAGSKGKKKLAQQYKKQIESIRKSGNLQKYKNSLKGKIKMAGIRAKKAGRAIGRGARKLARRVRGSKMQMPVGNYYFYFNTVPKAAQ